VLLASTAPSDTIASSCTNSSRLTSSRSTIASTTRSQSPSAASASAATRRARAAAASPVLIRPLSTSFAKTSSTLATAEASAEALLSYRRTVMPLCANSCAMPRPIAPLPTTPIRSNGDVLIAPILLERRDTLASPIRSRGKTVMLVLAGFAVSNYYNKVKFALLEKGVEFTEELNWATKDEPTLEASPLGKVPFLRTAQGTLCESQVILEYLEDAYPQVPLLPQEPFERAKVRELTAFVEIHVELVARRVYPQAFFGGTVSEGTIDATRRDLERGIAGFARLAKFAPF